MSPRPCTWPDGGWQDVHPDYGRCPICDRPFKLRGDGTLRQHFRPIGRASGYCHGSYGRPLARVERQRAAKAGGK
jgi:hypothetical protein